MLVKLKNFKSGCFGHAILQGKMTEHFFFLGERGEASYNRPIFSIQIFGYYNELQKNSSV